MACIRPSNSKQLRIELKNSTILLAQLNAGDAYLQRPKLKTAQDQIKIVVEPYVYTSLVQYLKNIASVL
jgi:hypothetical protein